MDQRLICEEKEAGKSKQLYECKRFMGNRQEEGWEIVRLCVEACQCRQLWIENQRESFLCLLNFLSYSCFAFSSCSLSTVSYPVTRLLLFPCYSLRLPFHIFLPGRYITFSLFTRTTAKSYTVELGKGEEEVRTNLIVLLYYIC